MRRFLQSGAIAVLSLTPLALVTGCGGGGSTTTTPPPAAISITTTSLPNGTEGTPYSQSVATSGGQGTRTWSITAGMLPTGLSLNASTGVISGTPTNPNSDQTFTIQVTDSTGSDTQQLTINIDPAPPPNITTMSLPAATRGVAYSQTLAVTSGVPPYTWSLSVGVLPSGLGLNGSSGVISGTPGCTSTTQNFTVRVTDSATGPGTDTQGLSITVNPAAALNFTTSALPNGAVGVAYSVFVQAVGGVPPYSFAVTSGMLPSMLNLNASTGRISGTPDTAETQNFTIRVTDSCGVIDAQALSMTVTATRPGPNNSRATATALSNGTFDASISPFGNPNTTTNPDNDFYSVSVAAGATLTVNVVGPGLPTPSPIDPVVEIVNNAGTRLTTCKDPGDNNPPAGSGITPDATPNAFDDACINDDISLGVTVDSMLQFQNTTAGALTVFIHVLDFRGDARPDFRYQLTISGAQ